MALKIYGAISIAAVVGDYFAQPIAQFERGIMEFDLYITTKVRAPFSGISPGSCKVFQLLQILKKDIAKTWV